MKAKRVERPECRRRIEEWVRSGRFTLKEISLGTSLDGLTTFNFEVKTQARKMLWEERER